MVQRKREKCIFWPIVQWFIRINKQTHTQTNKQTNKTALLGDLEEALLMISVAEDDRDDLRFLWDKNPFSEGPR